MNMMHLQNSRPTAGGLTQLIRRYFSDEVRGSFLDKSEVTDCVLSIVKNSQKVDPAKVSPNAHFQNDLGLNSSDSVEIVMALEEEFGYEIPVLLLTLLLLTLKQNKQAAEPSALFPPLLCLEYWL